MRRLRRHRSGILAAALVVLATLLVLFAVDVRTWQSTIRRDDMRFRALPDHTGLWRPGTILPGDPAGAALGAGDTIAWRRAMQSFWVMHIGVDPEASENLPALRAAAQTRLLRLQAGAATTNERSAAANLLGVLSITAPVAGSGENAVEQALHDAIFHFQQAIAIDPANADAKKNLELVLRITRPSKGPLGRSARAGFGFGPGHGATPLGNGY
jgi:hypothetical protein